jgi:tRNA (guanine26-N2/guanine27-N2)-dimethyltransferase
MYGGPLHNVDFIKRVLAQLKEVDRETYPTMDRIDGMLRTAMDEITLGAKGKNSEDAKEQLGPLIPKADPAAIDHHPFFFIPSSVSRIIHCSAPPMAALRGALRHAGFRVSMSHCKPGSIKTDASWRDIWHVMLEWVRQKAPLKNSPKDGTAGRTILSKGTAHRSKSVDKETVASKNTAPTLPGSAGEVRVSNAGDAGTLNAADGGDIETAGMANGDKAVQGDRPSYLGVDFEIKFDEQLGRDHDRGKLVRYQLAPRENWGPMSRAK